jgi:hypothetical protein
MKLPRTTICIAGVFIAAGFATSQAGAGVPPPMWCSSPQNYLMVIEINALRAGGKFIQAGPNQTRDVTAKARIWKGTAVPDTTLDITLTIEAADATDVISTNSTGPITIGVGKGGKGDKLPVSVPRCDGGFIEFTATFSGVDLYNNPCEETRTLRKDCR